MKAMKAVKAVKAVDVVKAARARVRAHDQLTDEMAVICVVHLERWVRQRGHLMLANILSADLAGVHARDDHVLEVVGVHQSRVREVGRVHIVPLVEHLLLLYVAPLLEVGEL